MLWWGLKAFRPPLHWVRSFPAARGQLGQHTAQRASASRGAGGAAACSLRPRALLLPFLLSCLLGRAVEERFLCPVVAGTAIQQNQTGPGEIFTLSPAASLKNAQTCPVEILVIQVQNPAVSRAQITLWSWLKLIVITLKHLKPDHRASRIWQTLLVWATKRGNWGNLLFSCLLSCCRENFPLLQSPSVLQLSLLVTQYFILWTKKYFTNQGHISRMKETPHLVYLSWLRVLAIVLSSIRFKLNRCSSNEPEALLFFSLWNIWRLRLGALLISVQYPSWSDQLSASQE